MQPQFVLTHNGTPDASTSHLLAQLKEIGRLQDVRHTALFETLRFRVNHEKEEASEAAREALKDYVRSFAQEHHLNLRLMMQRFAADQYPTEPDPIPVFNADFSQDAGWESAASEPIGTEELRAKILPAGLSTAEVLQKLSANADVFQKNGCQAIVIELSKQHQGVAPPQSEDGITVIKAHPDVAMKYICEQLGFPSVSPTPPAARLHAQSR